MKVAIAILGAFFMSGVLWRLEGHFIYHRPASAFSSWAKEVVE